MTGPNLELIRLAAELVDGPQAGWDLDAYEALGRVYRDMAARGERTLAQAVNAEPVRGVTPDE